MVKTIEDIDILIRIRNNQITDIRQVSKGNDGVYGFGDALVSLEDNKKLDAVVKKIIKAIEAKG